MTGNIDKNRIEQVYAGKPGCMCGCKGRYSENPAQITRVYNILLNNIDQVVVEDDMAYLLTETKNYVIYFKVKN